MDSLNFPSASEVAKIARDFGYLPAAAGEVVLLFSHDRTPKLAHVNLATTAQLRCCKRPKSATKVSGKNKSGNTQFTQQ